MPVIVEFAAKVMALARLRAVPSPLRVPPLKLSRLRPERTVVADDQVASSEGRGARVGAGRRA